MNYLQIDNISKSFGDLVLFENLSLSIDKGQRVALVAKNGAGKSTLLKIIGGKDAADSGNIIIRNGLSLGYLEQVPPLAEENSVMTEVMRAGENVQKAIHAYEEACASGNADAMAETSHEMDRLKAWDYETRVKQILDKLKIVDLEQEVKTLSGGQKKRLALAAIILSEPDIILLDEPTNHLDLDMIEWLEDYLNGSNCTLIMVTHDRYFLDRICNVIYEIDDMQMYRYKGNYSYYLQKRQERIEIQSAEIDKARNLYKKELDWINRMPSARGTKAKYRVDAFEGTKEKAHRRINNDQVKIDVASSRLGKKIVEIYNIAKRFDEKIILDDFTYNFRRGEKVGIVGGNGSGKSTLLNLITGALKTDAGHIEIGSTIRFGYYTQDGIQFDENKKVIEVIKEIAEDIDFGEGKKLSPIQFLNYFLFPPSMHYAYVSKLSGGEKRRLYLMTVLMQNPNFLILDEPSNDLDIMTLNVLEDYLQVFDGCVLIVSHDRYFMDKVVDHLFVFQGEGKIKDFTGDYTEYRSWADQQLKEKQLKAKEEKAKEVKLAEQAPVKIAEQTKTKLSYKEKQEFEQLEQELEDLTAEKEEIEALLSAGNLDAEYITEKSIRLNQLNDLLDEKEMRWLELSEFAG